MKRTIEQIVPLAPAVAAVGVSLCASSLLFPAPPQPVGPRPVSTPVTGQVGRVVASSVPIARPTSRRPVPTVRTAAPRTLAARARRAETPAPAPSQEPVRQEIPAPDPRPPPEPAPRPQPGPGNAHGNGHGAGKKCPESSASARTSSYSR